MKYFSENMSSEESGFVYFSLMLSEDTPEDEKIHIREEYIQFIRMQANAMKEEVSKGCC